MTARKWLNCRLADLQARLKETAHPISIAVLSRLLRKRDYRLRANVKADEDKSPQERDQQFVYLLKQRLEYQAAGNPVLSIDTKKKELVGNFKNAGRIWCQQAERVNVHDFLSQGEGKAVPYGLYDLTHNLGSVYVGQSADTAEFAVDNLAHWCEHEMPERFPQARGLLLHADCGGSNGNRCKLFKQQLQQKIADRFGIEVTVCHYPTGCSKWNPIEHRLFSEISKTWAGCPLRTYETILQYLRDTTTQTGLKVVAHLVTKVYQKGLAVAEEVMAALNITYHAVCPQWNYTIWPRTETSLLSREVISL
jgi:Rhodopirellula transposase DDE domain